MLKRSACKFVFVYAISGILHSCFRETPVEVIADFAVEIINSDYSVPVKVKISNKSIGADLYQWSFEGATPSVSNKITPEEALYDKAGTYTIRLEAWNSTERKIKEINIQLDSALSVGFTSVIRNNDFSPVVVDIWNYSVGSSTFLWTFEGGEPKTSDLQHPPAITFREPGDHIICLKISNGREVLERSEVVNVRPALVVDFDWNPAVGCEDMEVPFTAVLTNKTAGVLSCRWIAEGGIIADDTAVNTEIRFDFPGTYPIVLETTNGKETKRVEKKIIVKKNTNLYILPEVRLGIVTAQETIGCFYSSVLRKVLPPGEVTEKNGHLIDFAFFGLGETFQNCCFISPDTVAGKAFPDIPGSRHTWIINLPENFSAGQFDAMENDLPFRNLDIKLNSDQDLTTCFTKESVPHIVLFETYDGRKGAIKIKDFVAEGRQSYIVTDIKLQKEKK